MKESRLQYFLKHPKISREDQKFYKALEDLCNKNEHTKENAYYRFGYETFGIILYGFCKWLIADLKKQKICHILFFSRDGYIIKKAFEKMQESKEFNSDYIYVSRRSLRVPLLQKYESPCLKAICPTKYISIEDLLVSLGLAPQCYRELVDKYGFTFRTVVKDVEIEKSVPLKGLLNEIWEDVVHNSEVEYDNLKQYLSQYNLPEKVAVVDIGWRGSMQYFLGELLRDMGKETSLRGYYITLSSSMIKGLDIHGYLHDVDGNSEGCDLLRGYVGLIETLFLKQEGSVEKYRKAENGNMEPVLFECEYIDKDGNSSKEIDAVQEIQKGALQFIDDYAVSDLANKYSFCSETAFVNLSHFANHPSLSNLKLFADFRFYNGTVTYLAKAKPLVNYLHHPKQLKEDFYGCRWRTGFMKNLFKLPFPYYMILQIIVKLTV